MVNLGNPLNILSCCIPPMLGRILYVLSPKAKYFGETLNALSLNETNFGETFII